MTAIETAVAFVGAFVIVSTWRFAYRFVPWVYGASLTGILWGDEAHDEPAPFWTIVVRLLVPFVWGMVAALLVPQISTLAVLVMGGLAGLLVCWPNILEPYRMPPALWPRQTAVVIVYGMFMCLCAVASFVGARLARYLLGDGLAEMSAVGVGVVAGLLLALVLWIVRVAQLGGQHDEPPRPLSAEFEASPLPLLRRESLTGHQDGAHRVAAEHRWAQSTGSIEGSRRGSSSAAHPPIAARCFSRRRDSSSTVSRM